VVHRTIISVEIHAYGPLCSSPYNEPKKGGLAGRPEASANEWSVSHDGPIMAAEPRRAAGAVVTATDSLRAADLPARLERTASLAAAVSATAARELVREASHVRPHPRVITLLHARRAAALHPIAVAARMHAHRLALHLLRKERAYRHLSVTSVELYCSAARQISRRAGHLNRPGRIPRAPATHR
jgi:hypothetical protein